MNRPGIFWITFNPSDIATAKQFMESLKGDSTVDVLGLIETISTVLREHFGQALSNGISQNLSTL